MVFAVNILALLIVLGLCWGAMMWLGGRFHGQTTHVIDIDEFDDLLSSPVEPSGSTDACRVCEGVGAQHDAGRLAPCPQCLGTGVLN